VETILVWTLVISAIAIFALLLLLIASERELKRHRLETETLRAKLARPTVAREPTADPSMTQTGPISPDLPKLTEQLRANEVAIATLQCELEALRAENSWLKQESAPSRMLAPKSESSKGERVSAPAQAEQPRARRGNFPSNLRRRKRRFIFPVAAAAVLLVALVSLLLGRGSPPVEPVSPANLATDSQMSLAPASAVTTSAEPNDFKPDPLKADPELGPKSVANNKGPAVAAGTSYEVVRSTRVFAAPDESSAPLARVEAGMEVNVVGGRDGWLEVRSRHGRPPGFIRKDAAVPKP
jgi:hypothetical protein